MAYKSEYNNETLDGNINGISDSGIRSTGLTKSLYLDHPEVPNIKLMALAESSLLSSNGNTESTLFIKTLRESFYKIGEECFYSDKRDFKEYSEETLKKVMNRLLYPTYSMMRSKGLLTSATIVLMDDVSVYVCTIGDTACAYYKDECLMDAETKLPVSQAYANNDSFLEEMLNIDSFPDSYFGSEHKPVRKTAILPYDEVDGIVLMNRGVYSSLEGKNIDDCFLSNNIAASLISKAKEDAPLGALGYDPYGYRGMSAISFAKKPTQKLSR